MTKNIMILMFLSLFLTTNAIASLTYVPGTSKGVIYDNKNDTYWFSDLSVFTLWNFDQQITVIDTLPQNFSYPFIWHRATEQDILGLTQSYSPKTIARYFKASCSNEWEGWTQTESPYSNKCHVIYQITDYTAMGGDFYSTFIYNYTDNSHNHYLGAWVVGEPTWIPEATLNCLSSKLRAAGKLCNSYVGCYTKAIKKPSLNISASLEKAESKFESSWEKAEAKATTKGDDCATAAVTATEDIILLAIEDMYLQISAGLDLQNKSANRIGRAMLRAVGGVSKRLLMAEGVNKKKENADKLQMARANAYEQFEKRWISAMNQVEKDPEVTYTGPDMTIVVEDIDALVSDVLDGMESL